MKLEKLENLAKIQIGKTPKRAEPEYWGKGFPWVSISDLQSEVIENTKEEITEKAIKECGCKLIPKGTLIMSFKLSVGKLAFAGKDLYTNEAICGFFIKESETLDSKYFYYALKNTRFTGSNTAVMGNTLNTDSLNNLKIPYTSDLQEQKHIAAVLSKAEALIAERKQSIQLLDEYLKSTFLEMFGDPSRNKYKFPIGTIRDLLIEAKYGTSKAAEEEGSIPYLRMNNITYEGYMDFSNLKYINLDEKERSKYIVKKGDILFNRTNSKELVGKTGVFNEDSEMAIAGYLVKLKTNEKANPWFIWGYLNSKHGKETLVGMCKSIVGMANINAQELQEIKILIPPIKLQTQFAQIVEKTEALKTQFKSHLQELEQLYGALSQRAFRGGLKKG